MLEKASALRFVPSVEVALVYFLATVFQFPDSDWGVIFNKPKRLTLILELVLKEALLLPIFPHALDLVAVDVDEPAEPVWLILIVELPLEIAFVAIGVDPLYFLAFP